MAQQTIILDTNIISIFAELQRFPLLLNLLSQHKLYISPAIQTELAMGLAQQQTFIQSALNFIGQNQPIQVAHLTPIEIKILHQLPNRFMGTGEAEAMIICQKRGWVFASYDRKAINYCQRHNILVITLNDILAALWQGNVVTQTEVSEIINQLESTGRLIKNKAQILTKPSSS